MHHTKRAARQLAWREQSNPFSRPSHRSRQDTSPNRLESNQPSIARVRTDGILPPSPWRSQTFNYVENNLHSTTAPGALSSRRTDEPGDHIGQIPVFASPQASVIDLPRVRFGQDSYELPPQDDPVQKPARQTTIEDSPSAGAVPEVPSLRSKAVQQLKTVITATPTNALFVLVPVGLVMHHTNQHPAAVFVLNAVAILPSASMLGFGVDEIGLRTGEVIGGILSASSSNAAQLLSSVLLLRHRQLGVLHSSLLGVILSNLLFMTGLGFVSGGIYFTEQYFNQSLAQTICCLLMLAVLSLIVPSAAHQLTDMTEAQVLVQSRGIAIVIIISYFLWLCFQLRTHNHMFDRRGAKKGVPIDYTKIKRKLRALSRRQTTSSQNTPSLPAYPDLKDTKTVMTDQDSNTEIEEAVQPQLTMITTIILIAVSVTLLWLNTEYATDSIQGLLVSTKLTETFIGVVLLPPLSNDWLIILVAKQDKMDWVISITLEKCMQTTLLLVPLVVLIGWWIDIEMTLEFNSFVIAATFASMVMVSYVVQDGKSNWLLGALLIKAYVIISVAAYFIN